MLGRNWSRKFRTVGFFRSYFVLGVVGLSIVFFLYSNWVTRRLERETAEFSKRLATFVAQLPAIADKETSDAGRIIIEKLRFPYIVTDVNNQPIAARGIGNGLLREKIITGTLTPSDRQQIAKLTERMDKNHTPIPMKVVLGEQGRQIIGYIYYDQTKWSLNQASSFVITDVSGEPIFWQNIDGTVQTAQDKDIRLRTFIKKAREKGLFTTIQFNPPSQIAYFHYGRSGLIHQLKWWMPLAQIAMVATFLIIGWTGYQRIKMNEQQAIWAGLAKETAHQLSTPISSLMGWLEILGEHNIKDEKELSAIYKDMQNDVQRLKDITSRFGEIGSLPRREPLDVPDIIHRAVVYFQKRLPQRQKHVEIVESYQNVPKVEANENLLQWVIENLIRNSLDAIDKGDGKIQIKTEFDPKKREVLIIYKDNGKGIPRKDRGKIFLPGYSTKKHGWGLGLAIVKRIIEGYHGGRVKLSETGSEGSTFIIELPARG